MIVIGAGQGIKGAGRMSRYFARRGGRLGRFALWMDNRRTHRQMRKRGFL